MNEPLDQLPPDDRSPPAPPPRRGWPMQMQAAVRALLAAIALLGTSFVITWLTSGIDAEPVAKAVHVAAALLTIALTGCLAYTLRRNPARHGEAIGVWIGFGLGLLTHGFCFAFVQGLNNLS
jgi:hypothetical protein